MDIYLFIYLLYSTHEALNFILETSTIHSCHTLKLSVLTWRSSVATVSVEKRATKDDNGDSRKTQWTRKAYKVIIS